MNLFGRIRDFINTEIQEENEPKETVVLVRILCLVDILFTLSNAFFLFIGEGTLYGLIALAFIISFGLELALSYRIKTHTIIGIYYFVGLLSGVYFTLCLGVSPMYHIQIFTLFLLYFYRSAETSFSRHASVILCGVTAVIAVFYVIKNGTFVDVDQLNISVLIVVNTGHILLKLALIAYFFRLKFSASETKILQYSRKLEMIATTDPLTKLQNRRGMYTYLENLVKDENDKNFALTLGIGDIDFFKKINDTYGHEAGDYVLETLSKLMKEFMKDFGMAARWGGEEFLFAFEGINGDYAFESLSKLLHIIERYEFSYNDIDFHVTMTFGIEEYDEREGIEKTISKADEKLYMGKEAGRDRVIY